MERPSVDDYFGDWKAREALAQEMLPIMGKLENERGVQIFLYGRTLNNRSVANIMISHRRVREVARNELSEFESSQVLNSLAKLDLSPAQIDLGKLTVKYMEALEGIADGQATKVFLPLDTSGVLGSVAAIGELFKESQDEPASD